MFVRSDSLITTYENIELINFYLFSISTISKASNDSLICQSEFGKINLTPNRKPNKSI